MRAVGIKSLKNNLSEYIRQAQSGETVLVTERDRVDAELIPPRQGRAASVSDATLAELVRTGLLTPPSLPAAGPPPSLPVKKLKQILIDLDRDRADR
jgi:prevent-host-death family protein